MKPHFADYLTKILFPCADGSPPSPEEYKTAFSDYLSACGIEYFNFGTFGISEGGIGRRYFAALKMDLAWQCEYLHSGYIDDDFVLNRALAAARRGRFASFRFGEETIPRLGEAEAGSVPVLRGAADAGLVDGVGIVGSVPAEPDGTEEIVWGLALGGAAGSAAAAAEQIEEIKVAVFALLDGLKPELDAMIEGADPELTPRERDVLAAFAAGLRRDRVAHRLGITLPTVDLHAANLRRKLGARTVSEAVAKGYRYRLL